MTPEELRQRIRTVVIVMMENRSFDHLLGHLSLPQFGARAVNGLDRLDNPDFANARENGEEVYPVLAQDDTFLTNDLPHEREFVSQQLAYAPAAGGYQMNGFVRAYENFTGTTGVVDPPPMRAVTPGLIPVTRFFSDNFVVCDAWHAPLPTSTQPNRLMAVSGYTLSDATISGLLPDQDTMFDWCERKGVRWRVYSAGLSFFTLMSKMWPRLLTDSFKSISSLAYDVQHEPEATFPQVIFVEPDYDDSPVHLSGHACDNHPPVPLSYGEVFLKSVYDAITSNPARWGSTVMFVTYDEHGGFFDHEAPLEVASPAPNGASFSAGFTSTGVRVPALVVSPYAPAAQTCSINFDHTSILQLLAELFDRGAPYSPTVDARRNGNVSIRSASEALSARARTDTPRAPQIQITATGVLSDIRAPISNAQTSFAASLEAFASDCGQDALSKYPEIAHWLATRKA